MKIKNCTYIRSRPTKVVCNSLPPSRCTTRVFGHHFGQQCKILFCPFTFLFFNKYKISFGECDKVSYLSIQSDQNSLYTLSNFWNVFKFFITFWLAAYSLCTGKLIKSNIFFINLLFHNLSSS